MRGTLAGLANPHPLLRVLPGLYAEDDLAARLTGVFDEVLAPVVATLDNLPGYLDPALTPHDFVPVLGSWVAAFDDQRIPDERRRALVSAAVDLHRIRGSAAALAETIRLACDVSADVTESGGTSWSAEPGSAAPGSSDPQVVVKVAEGTDLSLVRRVVDALRPASVPARIELIPQQPGEVDDDPVQ